MPYFQHLQAAKHRLLEKKLDFILVIGGMDSSNTLQIQEIAELKGIPWYWIENEKKLGPGNKICYKNVSLYVEIGMMSSHTLIWAWLFFALFELFQY